jgi:hypothetical protein
MAQGDLRGLRDVLLDRQVSKDVIHSGLCRLFSLRPEQVTVLEGGEREGDRDNAELVLCEVYRLGGDFPTLLSLWEGLSAPLPPIPTAARLCQLLGCRCLVDDGTVDPFTFLLVEQGGQARPVGVDTERCDRDEYVIDPDWPGC